MFLLGIHDMILRRSNMYAFRSTNNRILVNDTIAPYWLLNSKHIRAVLFIIPFDVVRKRRIKTIFPLNHTLINIFFLAAFLLPRFHIAALCSHIQSKLHKRGGKRTATNIIYIIDCKHVHTHEYESIFIWENIKNVTLTMARSYIFFFIFNFLFTSNKMWKLLEKTVNFGWKKCEFHLK